MILCTEDKVMGTFKLCRFLPLTYKKSAEDLLDLSENKMLIKFAYKAM